jgi:hypothetical protein
MNRLFLAGIWIQVLFVLNECGGIRILVWNGESLFF